VVRLLELRNARRAVGLTDQVDERKVQPRDVLSIVLGVLRIAQHEREIRRCMLLHTQP